MLFVTVDQPFGVAGITLTSDGVLDPEPGAEGVEANVISSKLDTLDAGEIRLSKFLMACNELLSPLDVFSPFSSQIVENSS